jgi:hypothetical protein
MAKALEVMDEAPSEAIPDPRSGGGAHNPRCPCLEDARAEKKELAIKNYERSVELNANNTGGIEALKKLREGKQD